MTAILLAAAMLSASFSQAVDEMAKPPVFDVDAAIMASVVGFKAPDKAFSPLCIMADDGTALERGQYLDKLSCREYYDRLKKEMIESTEDARYSVWACWAFDPCGQPK